MQDGVTQDKEVMKILREEWKARTAHAEKLERLKAYDNEGLLREWAVECDSKHGDELVAEALWVLLETRLILVGYLPAPPIGQTAAGREKVRRTVAFRDGTNGHAVMVVEGTSLLGERINPAGGADPERLFWDGGTLTKRAVVARRKERAQELSAQQKARLDHWLVLGRLLYDKEGYTW